MEMIPKYSLFLSTIEICSDLLGHVLVKLWLSVTQVTSTLETHTVDTPSTLTQSDLHSNPTEFCGILYAALPTFESVSRDVVNKLLKSLLSFHTEWFLQKDVWED